MSGELTGDPARHIRKVRNIEIWPSDLLPLEISGSKIPSTALNAYCAQFQHLDQLEHGTTDYAIFSSWLGAYLSGFAKESKMNGTIEEQVKAAVSLIEKN